MNGNKNIMTNNQPNGINHKPSDQDSWGKLTAFNLNLENITLFKDSYTFGRNSSNDIIIEDIKLSGTHCRIYRNENGESWCEDLSSNGTFIEDKKIGKGNSVKLSSGDKIYLLHKSKVKKEEVMGYVFSAAHTDTNLLKKQREEELKELEETKKQTEKSLKFQEELGEEMRCVICIDYIYQCVSTIPCLHNFCGGCLSEWIQKSNECPNCREEVIEIKKNPMINNLIEKFLDNNPDKKRSKEEYEELDKKNCLKDDKVNLAEYKKKKNPVQPQTFRPVPNGVSLFHSLNHNLPRPPQQQVVTTNLFSQNYQNNRNNLFLNLNNQGPLHRTGQINGTYGYFNNGYIGANRSYNFDPSQFQG